MKTKLTKQNFNFFRPQRQMYQNAESPGESSKPNKVSKEALARQVIYEKAEHTPKTDPSYTEIQALLAIAKQSEWQSDKSKEVRIANATKLAQKMKDGNSFSPREEGIINIGGITLEPPDDAAEEEKSENEDFAKLDSKGLQEKYDAKMAEKDRLTYEQSVLEVDLKFAKEDLENAQEDLHLLSVEKENYEIALSELSKLEDTPENKEEKDRLNENIKKIEEEVVIQKQKVDDLQAKYDEIFDQKNDKVHEIAVIVGEIRTLEEIGLKQDADVEPKKAEGDSVSPAVPAPASAIAPTPQPPSSPGDVAQK